MMVLGARSRSSSTIMLLVCGLCLLSLVPSIEGLFKLVKKKKFMEGFLVGFLVGNEYALHKSPGKAAPDYHGGGMPQLSGMDYHGGISPNYLDHHQYIPKKFDRSYRIKPPKFMKPRSKKSKIKNMLKFPVYIRKPH